MQAQPIVGLSVLNEYPVLEALPLEAAPQCVGYSGRLDDLSQTGQELAAESSPR